MSINLDPVLIKKISTMSLRARYVAEGYISGLHQSPYRGSSLEFAQHRQYSPGDELKYLDWKVYGRTDRFYVKQYHEDTNLRGYCIIDSSRSMGYTSKQVTKLEYSKYLSAALTYLMIKQRDSAGLINFNQGIEDFIPPRNFKAHMQLVMDKLEDIEARRNTDFQKSFSEIGRRIKKRSLLILFSDLIDEPDKIIKSLKFFPYLKNDLIVFHILDPEEINLTREGDIEYIDMETGEKIKTRPQIIRKDYQKKINEYLKRIERGLRSHEIDYYRATTDMSLDRTISMFMEGRKKILQ